MEYKDIFVERALLPKPLKETELISYFERLQAGDTSACSIIFEHKMRLVYNEVLKKYSYYHDLSELISLGLMGLYKSILRFDISKNKKFSTYAVRCIDNEIIIYLRKENKNFPIQSLYNPVYKDNNGKNITLEGTLVAENIDIVKDYERKETNKIIRQLVEELPNKKKEIIKLYFGFYDREYSQQEIANKFHITIAYVSLIIKKELTYLAQKLKSQGITAELKLSKKLE